MNLNNPMARGMPSNRLVTESYGNELRRAITEREIIPFIGVYDVFSASIAARHYDGLFISGFSFAASFYGLPDIGFISWSDIAAYVQRVRTLLPNPHIIVDIDDGYCDTEVACHVTSLLESMGASAVVLEDQLRPRQCGHYDGKQIMLMDDYLHKLERVLASRQSLFVVARTDAVDPDEASKRAIAYANVGADAVLVEAVKDLDILKDLAQALPCPLLFNQIAGGKSPSFTLDELKQAGVQLVNYSTPCLFAAQSALEKSMLDLSASGGKLPEHSADHVDLGQCTTLLNNNLNQCADK
jgi:2-methylisocitrate lyase-like PEP mutase family enzyme